MFASTFASRILRKQLSSDHVAMLHNNESISALVHRYIGFGNIDCARWGWLATLATQCSASAQCCVCGNMNVNNCCVIQQHVCHCALASTSLAVVLLGAMGKCGGSRRVGVIGAVGKRIWACGAVTQGKHIGVAGTAAKQLEVIARVPKNTNSSGTTSFSERLREFVEHFHRRPPRSTALGKRLHLELKKTKPDPTILKLVSGLTKMWGASVAKLDSASKINNASTRLFIRNQRSRQIVKHLPLPCRMSLPRGRPKTTSHPNCSLGASLPEGAKQVLYNMLADFMEIIRTLGPKSVWFLIRGSLLGAIREKAVIPWDDDIDVMVVLEGGGTVAQRMQDFWQRAFPMYVVAFEKRGWVAFKAGTHLARVKPRVGKSAETPAEKWQACKDAVTKLDPSLSRAAYLKQASKLYSESKQNNKGISGGFLRLDIHIATIRPRCHDVVLHNDQGRASARADTSVLLPTKVAKFGQLEVKVPQKPEVVLEACYGPMWRTPPSSSG